MAQAPTNIVEALSFLLTHWVEAEFPREQRQETTASSLRFMWGELLRALGGYLSANAVRSARGANELMSKNGDPPFESLERFIGDMKVAGLREFFLVIAIRQALDRLIAERFPESAAAWQSLADDILPLWVQFGHTSDELSPTFQIPRPADASPDVPEDAIWVQTTHKLVRNPDTDADPNP